MVMDSYCIIKCLNIIHILNSSYSSLDISIQMNKINLFDIYCKCKILILINLLIENEIFSQI